MGLLDDLIAQQSGGGILDGMYPSPLPGDAQPRIGGAFQTGAAPFGFAGLAAMTPPQAPFPPAGGNGASAWIQPSFAAPDVSVMGVDPSGLAADGRYSPIPQGAQQMSSTTFQNCANGHRLCVASGRNPVECMMALNKCRNGVPTIFGPGIVGRPG
jgi:hypothetical protein